MKPTSGFLGSHSIWNQDVSAAPLAPDSSTLVGNVASQVAKGTGGTAAFNVWSYNGSFYEVPAGTPKTTMLWDNCQKKTSTPPQLFDPAKGGHFLNVPMPAEVVPAVGTDGAATLWDPRTDQLWEFWKLRKDDAGWHACWGGRIDNWSQSRGFFGDGMGVSASGLSVASGLIGIREMQAGRIDHAMNLSLLDVRHWSEFSFPAQRSDGNMLKGAAGAVAEGQRFRLDPTVNVERLPLTPVGKIIARAAQKYGFIVVDRSGKVGVGTESGAGAATVGATNPWNTIMGSTPSYSIMNNFPWQSLQAISYNYGK